MNPQEFKELLQRFSQGECDPKEEKFILDWYENIGKNEKEEMEATEQDDLLERKLLESHLWAKINPYPRKGFNFRSFLKVAAAILLLAVAGLGGYLISGEATLEEKIVALKKGEILTDESFSVIVNKGIESKKIVLDDGSTVVLEPRSELRFVKNFNPDHREVHLTGEAFFHVKRDIHRPFFVYSNEVVTQVLGTSFSIKAYKDDKEITVAVKTGKVSVYTARGHETSTSQSDRQALILTPNQQVVYDRNHNKVFKQLVENPQIILPNPTLFTMSYDDVPVTRILKVLEENYGVDIEFDEEILSGCVLTTSMSDEGLYERIEVICRAINAEYTITNAVIFIKSPGCI